MTVLFALAVVITLLNFQLGRSMMKKHGKWQFGLLNWGVALFIGATTVELGMKIL